MVGVQHGCCDFPFAHDMDETYMQLEHHGRAEEREADEGDEHRRKNAKLPLLNQVQSKSNSSLNAKK